MLPPALPAGASGGWDRQRPRENSDQDQASVRLEPARALGAEGPRESHLPGGVVPPPIRLGHLYHHGGFVEKKYFQRKRVCRFCNEKKESIDYKEVQV